MNHCSYVFVHTFFVFVCCSAKQPGSYDEIIVNDDLEAAYGKLKSILKEVSTVYPY
jgi:guanylate kinase